MNRSLYVSADLDNIEDLIKVLKRAKKQMEELSDDGELPVEVEIMDSKTSELVVGKVRYIEEYRVGPKL